MIGVLLMLFSFDLGNISVSCYGRPWMLWDVRTQPWWEVSRRACAFDGRRKGILFQSKEMDSDGLCYMFFSGCCFPSANPISFGITVSYCSSTGIGLFFSFYSCRWIGNMNRLNSMRKRKGENSSQATLESLLKAKAISVFGIPGEGSSCRHLRMLT